jgi:hypothetical protein
VRLTTKENIRFGRGRVLGGDSSVVGRYIHFTGKSGALVDLAHRQAVKGGSRLLWLLLILCFTTIGPIAYLAWGRNA